MSISNLRRKRQWGGGESTSRVLLVCVYDTIVLEIDNETVLARFSAFGPIIKILIFERGEVTKFFIEYAHVESAEQARLTLDGAKLYEAICKMSIYYSNFTTVDLKHETSEGILLQSSAYPRPSSIPPPFPALFPLTIENALQDQHLFQDEPADQCVLADCSSRMNIRAQELERLIENDINWLLQSGEKRERQEAMKSNEVQREKENSTSKCELHFKLIGDVNNLNIYNLFSNFGNIAAIMRYPQYAVVTFRSLEYSAMARNYLEGHCLAGNRLHFNSTKYPISDIPIETTLLDHSSDRFTAAKSITINPPSQVLHVSSLKRQICRPDSLRRLFEEFGRVQKVEILAQGGDKNMALVKLGSLQESFAAISQMHGRTLWGRKIQISFTKSRLL